MPHYVPRMAKRSSGLAILLVLTATAGCSGSTPRVTSAGPSTSAPAAPSSAPAPSTSAAPAPSTSAPTAAASADQLTTMLEAYLGALRDGDFVGAMAHRCRAARVSADNRELFVQQSVELLQMAPVTGVTVSVPGSLVVAPAGGADPATAIQFDYSLRHAGPAGAPLHGVAVVEDGELRFCGYAQPAVDRIRRELDVAVVAGPSPAAVPHDLMPDAVSADYRQASDGENPLQADAPPGRIDSWTRSWAHGGFGGVRVTATRYGTPAQAAHAWKAALDRYASDVTETFPIAGLPAARGIRYSAVAWTWMQPPGAGFQIDGSFELRGNTVISTLASALRADDGHDAVEAFARAADAVAGRV